MRTKHQKTLNAIFAYPIRPVAWHDIEALIKALGGKVKPGSGSRVRMALGARLATIHRPHGKEANKETVKDIRTFLKEAGYEPDTI